MRLEPYFLPTLLVVSSICAIWTPQSYSKQVFLQEEPELRDAQMEHLSLFSVIVANGESWRMGDCLVRVVTTFDGVADQNARITGLMSRTERLSRFAFDHDQRRYLRISLERSEITNYESDPPDSLSSTRWRGDCYDVSTSRYSTNGSAGHFETGIAENPTRVLGHYPDYRCYPLRDGSMDVDQVSAAKSFVEHLKTRINTVTLTSLPNNRLKLRMVELSPKIEVSSDPQRSNSGTEPRITKLVAEWNFDQRSLLPTSSRTALEGTFFEPQTVAQEIYRWKNVDDVFVPIFAQRVSKNRKRETVIGEIFRGTETTEYTFHWFSLNKPLDESYFDGSKFRDEQTVLKHVVPELAGAESLLTDPENPPIKPHSTDEN